MTLGLEASFWSKYTVFLDKIDKKKIEKKIARFKNKINISMHKKGNKNANNE